MQFSSAPWLGQRIFSHAYSVCNAILPYIRLPLCSWRLFFLQADAVEVDTGVLAVGPDGSSEEMMLRKKQNCVLKTPQAWVRSSTDNLNMARQLTSDSTR